MPAIRKADLPVIAATADRHVVNSEPNSIERAYAMGVEDLARLLVQRDPGPISEVLVRIVKDAGLRDTLPELYRWGA